VFPEPVPPLIKKESFASIMRDKAERRPGSMNLRPHGPRVKSSAAQAPATRCRFQATPNNRAQHALDCHLEAGRQQRAPHRPNPQFDIFVRL